MKKLIYAGLIGVIVIMWSVSSCKKYIDPPPYFEDTTAVVQNTSRRVLLIGIDGAVGMEWKTINPPQLLALQAHSKYAWDALSDDVTTDAASWKTLLTGVSYSTHKINDSSFKVVPPIGTTPEDYTITHTPSLFNYILTSTQSDLRTAMASSWSKLLNTAAPEVERKMLCSGDAAVKDSIVSVLKNNNYQVVVAHFNGPAIAGLQSGFSASSAGYKNSVLQIDTYIGEIMTALKSRPNYNKNEEWLVIINGTHGGEGNSYGTGKEKEVNVLSFYYNEKFKKLEFTKEGALYTTRIFGRTTDATYTTASLATADYNAGTGQQTFQIKIKGTGPFNWPHFMSKTTSWPYPQEPGWSMFTSSTGNWAMSVMKGGGAGDKRLQPATPNIFDGFWHTLTFVVYDSASKKWIKRFVDKIRIEDDNNTRNITGYDLTNAVPISLGWGIDKGFGAMSYNFMDMTIFNTALSDDEIKSNICLQDITKHPKYANLTGYWPATEALGGTIYNKVAGGANLNLKGNVSWNNISTVPCSFSVVNSPDKATKVMSNADAATNIFYWLRIKIADSWGLQGTQWLPLYDKEFIK